MNLLYKSLSVSLLMLLLCIKIIYLKPRHIWNQISQNKQANSKARCAYFAAPFCGLCVCRRKISFLFLVLVFGFLFCFRTSKWDGKDRPHTVICLFVLEGHSAWGCMNLTCCSLHGDLQNITCFYYRKKGLYSRDLEAMVKIKLFNSTWTVVLVL